MAEINETLTAKKGTAARSGSAVVIDGLKIGNEELFSAQQQVVLSDKTKKLRLASNTQKVSVIQHETILLAVTQGDNSVAYIERKDGQSTLKISQEYFDRLAGEDEQIKALGGTPEDGYYSLNISEARLGQDLSIQDLQISGTDGQTFSVSFSALGCHLSGSGKNADIRNTDAQPFDMAVSTQFMQNALSNENGCSYGEGNKKISDKVMQNLLISSIRLQRESIGKDDPQYTKPIKNTFGLFEIISVPYGKNETTDAINSIEFFRDTRNNKVYVYHHSKGSSNSEEFVPTLSEIHDCQVQQNDKGEIQLSFGLGNGNEQRLVLPFSRNNHYVDNLDYLQQNLLSKQFEQTNSFDGSEPKILLLSGIGKNYTFNAFTTPKEGSFVYFDENVSQLQRTFTETPNNNDSDNNGNNDTSFVINPVEEPPVEPIVTDTTSFATFNNNTNDTNSGGNNTQTTTPVEETAKVEKTKPNKKPRKGFLRGLRTLLTKQPWNGGLIAVTLVSSVFIFPFFYIITIFLASVFILERTGSFQLIEDFLNSLKSETKEEKLKNKIKDRQKAIEKCQKKKIREIAKEYNQQLKDALAGDLKAILAQLTSKNKKTKTNGLINDTKSHLQDIENKLKTRERLEKQIGDLKSLTALNKDSKEYKDLLTKLQTQYPELKKSDPTKLLSSATASLNKLPETEALKVDKETTNQKLKVLQTIQNSFEGMSPNKFDTIKLLDLTKIPDGWLPKELIEKLNNFNKLVKFMGDLSDIEINPDDLDSIKQLKKLKRDRKFAEQQLELIVNQEFDRLEKDEALQKLIKKRKAAEETLTNYQEKQKQKAAQKLQKAEQKKNKENKKKANKKIKKGDELLENEGLENFEIKPEKTPEQIAAEAKINADKEEENKKKNSPKKVPKVK